MRAIRRISTRKLALAAGVLLLIAGGTLAAVTVGDEGKSGHATRAGASAHEVPAGQRGPAGRRAPARDLALAGSYLGISLEQLTRELRLGQSLAQIANGRPGRSASGLIDILVAAKRRRLSALSAELVQRVTAEVNARGATALRALRPRGARLGLGRHRLLGVAANYLGLSPRQLTSELRAGQSLAQIADARGSGRSAAGLRDTLLAAVRARLDVAVSAGRITKARADVIRSRLPRRLNAFLNRRRQKR